MKVTLSPASWLLQSSKNRTMRSHEKVEINSGWQKCPALTVKMTYGTAHCLAFVILTLPISKVGRGKHWRGLWWCLCCCCSSSTVSGTGQHTALSPPQTAVQETAKAEKSTQNVKINTSQLKKWFVLELRPDWPSIPGPSVWQSSAGGRGRSGCRPCCGAVPSEHHQGCSPLTRSLIPSAERKAFCNIL